MEKKGIRRRVSTLIAAILLTGLLSPHTGAFSALPDALVLPTGGQISVDAWLPLSVEVSKQDAPVLADVKRCSGASVNLTAGETSGTTEVVFRLMGLVPVKTMTVTVEQPRILIPGGQSLGVAMRTEGVVVVGASDLGTTPSPARKAGIRPGDVIKRVDAAEIGSASELSQQLRAGKTSILEVDRQGDTLLFEVEPGIDPRDGASRLGVWVRDSTAGVGTLTYFDPADGSFGALGHAITDVDTGVQMPVGDGAVYQNEVVQITKGRKGAPGELTGAFFEEEIVVGDIDRNTEFGIFGSAESDIAGGALYPDGLPAARSDEVQTGPAQLLTTLQGQGSRAYDCEIERINTLDRDATRSMVVRITDPQLLAETGGIVQGMSGSPIIQDGKLVGAVTHVLVNDPTRGYGIFIENMLEAAG